MPMRAPILFCCAVMFTLPACRGWKEGKGGGKPSGKDKAAAGKDFQVSSVAPGEDETGSGSAQGKDKKSKKKKAKVVLGEGVAQVQVPGGDYIFGSATGEPFRDPSKEIDATKVKVKPFLIDRYPYPNQKGADPLTNVSYEEAGKLCEKEGKRLCTELEWEIACKGPDSEQVIEGEVSGFGMESFFQVYEWTASEWLEPELPNPRGMVVKGYAPTQMVAAGKPRCSARSIRQDDKATGNLGLRCCQGEVNEIKAVLEPLEKPFEEVKDFPLDKFKLFVRSTPEMKEVKSDPKMFSEEDQRYVLLRREIDTEKEYAGYIFTRNPVWWRPVRGEELLVMTGFSGKNSFVLALYHLGEGKFKHASSLVLLESDAATVQLPIPLILVAGVDRTVINWAPCWNCSEGGSLYLDDKIDTEHTGDFLIHLSYRWGP